MAFETAVQQTRDARLTAEINFDAASRVFGLVFASTLSIANTRPNTRAAASKSISAVTRAARACSTAVSNSARARSSRSGGIAAPASRAPAMSRSRAAAASSKPAALGAIRSLAAGGKGWDRARPIMMASLARRRRLRTNPSGAAALRPQSVSRSASARACSAWPRDLRMS